MGVLNSTIALVTNCFKGKDRTKESNQIPTASDAQDQIPTQQPPLVSEQQQAEAALQVEHLASTAPILPTKSHPSGTSAAENPGSVKEGEAVITNKNRTPTNLEPSTKEEHKMASDEDYASFLDKANEDPSAGSAPKTQGNGKVEFKALDSGVKVPAVLEKVEAYYVSDADEEFVPVCLKLSGKGLPDEKTFAKLINHPNPKDAQVSIMDIGEWDPRGQYKEVVDAVREAGKGSDVRVYRIEKGGTRVEYWVVSVEDGKLVGVKALAVES